MRQWFLVLSSDNMLSAGLYEQTKFKPHVPGNLAGSRNVPHECVHCHITKPPGAPAFPICAGCKLVRYCVSNQQLIFNPHLVLCLIKAHRTESIRLLTGKLTSRFANLRNTSTRTPCRVCVPPPKCPRPVSRWRRRWYISRKTFADCTCGLCVLRWSVAFTKLGINSMWRRDLCASA